jgi:hypothetical protein
VKPIGWADGEILTNEQMDALDTDHANAVDGVGGGNYNALTAPLTLAGDNVNLCNTGADVCTIGDSSSNTLIVKAATDFQSGVNVSAGSSSIAGAVSFASGGTVALQGPTTVTGVLTYFSAGRPVYKINNVTTNGNISVTPVTANIYYMADGVINAGRDWTISDTNCVDGDWMELISDDGTDTVSVRRPGPVTIASIGGGSGQARGVRVTRIGGTWRVTLLGNVV